MDDSIEQPGFWYRALRAITPLRRAVRWARGFIDRYCLPTWLLEGTERVSGQPLRVFFAGQLENKNYIAHLAFAASPAEQVLGQRWLWMLLPPKRKQESDGVDLWIVELYETQRRWPSARFQFFVPIWVGGELNLQSVVARLQRSKNAKADLRRMRRNETTYEVTREPEAYEYFYSNMYLPYITNTYADRAFPMSREEMIGKRGYSELFFIKVHGERVAGNILLYEGARARAWSTGVKDGDHSYVNEGAIKALNYLRSQYLTERGYTTLHLGGSRPFLSDGVLRHKRELGFRISDHTKRYFSLSFTPGSVGARAFAANHPFIYENKGAYRGALFIEPGVSLSQERLHELYAECYFDGLAGLSLFDARTGGKSWLTPISEISPNGENNA